MTDRKDNYTVICFFCFDGMYHHEKVGITVHCVNRVTSTGMMQPDCISPVDTAQEFVLADSKPPFWVLQYCIIVSICKNICYSPKYSFLV